MALALREDRILLTEDKDFGWLVFAARLNSPGVIRFPATSRAALADAVTRLVHEHANALAGAFVVLQPGLARFSPHLNLIKSPHSAVPSNRQGVAPATNTRNPNE
jgi:hypothetical protein